MGHATWDAHMEEEGHACDNRRFDVQPEEQPINKNSILSEHGQH